MKTLEGIGKKRIKTSRLEVSYFEKTGGAENVVFIHGNVSSGAFWQEVMTDLPERFCAYAPDLRGYGDTEPLPVNAELGLDDMTDDVVSFVEKLGLKSFHLVGHSMGGGICMKLARSIPNRLLSMTLVDPMSPYGFSGSMGIDGRPCFADGAPAGAAGVSPDFVKFIAEKYKKDDQQMAPINVFRSFYVKPPFIPEHEDLFLESMLSTRVGDDWYPGDTKPSEHWPGAAPGKKGIVNAFSRRYFDASDFTAKLGNVPILWIRGEDDQIVANTSMFDIAALGALGAVPGWPGADVCPPQPMVDQTRAVLEEYQQRGGSFTEVIIKDSGHSPFIDKKDDFNVHFHSFIST